MRVESFIRLAVSEFAEQVRKEEPGISQTALIRKCVELASAEIETVAKQAAEDASQYADSLSREVELDYWGQLASWTPEEAAYLVLGFEPRGASLIGLPDAETQRRFDDLRRVAERYSASSNDQTPAALFRHMERFHNDACSKMRRTLKKYSEYYMIYEKRYNNVKDKQIKNAENRDSHLKIIYAIAVEHYGYSQDKRTDAVKNIKGAVNRSGLNLSEKPIRKILDAAADRFKSLKLKQKKT